MTQLDQALVKDGNSYKQYARNEAGVLEHVTTYDLISDPVDLGHPIPGNDSPVVELTDLFPTPAKSTK